MGRYGYVCVCIRARASVGACVWVYAACASHARASVSQAQAYLSLSARDTGVCEKTLLRIRRRAGTLALKTPNQGLESSFCCWIALSRFARKDCLFHRRRYVCRLQLGIYIILYYSIRYYHYYHYYHYYYYYRTVLYYAILFVLCWPPTAT